MSRLARVIDGAISTLSPQWGAQRAAWRAHERSLGNQSAYHAANPRISTPVPFQPHRGTANQALIPSLSWLIARSRDLQRNHPVARAAIEGRVGLVVGRGISVNPDSGDDVLDEILDDGFTDWADGAFVDGTSLWEGQRIAYRAWVGDGGFLWRWVIDADLTKHGLIPDRLMELDVDWLADMPVGAIDAECVFVGGIEYDAFNRPRWFHLRNPDTTIDPLRSGASVFAPGERVPADQIIHGFRKLRPGQGRGEPELAPSILWLWNGHSLIEAELKSAVVGAAPAVAIKTQAGADIIDTLTAANPGYDAAVAATSAAMSGQPSAPSIPHIGPTLPAGGVVGLLPGEDVSVIENKRPSQGIFPFLKAMWGPIAASLRMGTRMLNRDYSDANYSSLRADQLDTRRLLEPEQDCFGRFAASTVYVRIAPLIAAMAGRPFPQNPTIRQRLLRHGAQPDGWAYVDPQRDLAAIRDAIRAKLTTFTDEVAKRGGNLRRLWRQSKKDDALAAKLGITPDLTTAGQPPQPLPEDTTPDSPATTPPAAPAPENPAQSTAL